jgi:hypothetical protein
VLGWQVEGDYVERQQQRQAKLAAMSGDELAQLLVMVAIENSPSPYGQGVEHRCNHRLALAARYGVDVMNAAGAAEEAAA